MTTTTAHSSARHAKRRGITLVELMIAVSISAMILAGVMSTFLFLSRGTIATTDYADMELEARGALEQFAREVRMANGVTSFTTNSVTLSVLDGTAYAVNYTYVPADGVFYRAYGTAGQKALISGIERFALRGYNLIGIETKKPLETKLIQLDLRAVRTGPAKAFASNNVISARYIMRNKLVAE